MPLDLPPGSVSGRDGWHWNRLIDDDQSNRNPTATTAPLNSGTNPRSQQRIDRLESQLRREKHRTQAIIDQYERVLDEKHRQLAAAESSEAASSWLETQFHRLHRLL